MEEHLIIIINRGMIIAKWHIYAAFIVHDYCISHTGGIFTMSWSGGFMIILSIKENLNLHSSTEAELTCVDGMLCKIL